MQAIVTKYLAPTNFRGARIKATAQAGSVTVPWDYSLSVDANHDAARAALRKKLYWEAPHYWNGSDRASTVEPIQGCATFVDHMYERAKGTKAPHSWVCLAEVHRGMRYRYLDSQPAEITIERVRLNSQGYGSNGQYYGTGMSVFELTVDAPDAPEGSPLSYSHGVRAPDRAWLRAVLKRLFPLAKVGR